MQEIACGWVFGDASFKPAAARAMAILKIGCRAVLPPGLAIVRDTCNTTYDATHYTIAPAYDMPLEHFKMLLSELAKQVMKEVA